MNRLSILLLLFSTFVLGDIFHCPSDDPCVGCSQDCDYICVTIPPGYHDSTLEDDIELVENGYKGLTDATMLEYRIVFHNSTLNYPCDTWCSNENKLFGFSRGFIPVMDMSCMFSWRSTFLKNEPKNKINVWGYGWYNVSMPPWEHPEQNPFMGYFDVETEYIFRVKANELNCTYEIFDNKQNLLSSAFTPQLPFDYGPSYYFVLFFGGEETTTVPVTVSYSKNIQCDSNIELDE